MCWTWLWIAQETTPRSDSKWQGPFKSTDHDGCRFLQPRILLEHSGSFQYISVTWYWTHRAFSSSATGVLSNKDLQCAWRCDCVKPKCQRSTTTHTMQTTLARNPTSSPRGASGQRSWLKCSRLAQWKLWKITKITNTSLHGRVTCMKL